MCCLLHIIKAYFLDRSKLKGHSRTDNPKTHATLGTKQNKIWVAQTHEKAWGEFMCPRMISSSLSYKTIVMLLIV